MSTFALSPVSDFNCTALVNVASDTLDILEREEDLSPKNPVINRALSDFVGAVLNTGHNDSIAGNIDLKRIRPRLLPLLARAEYEMEKYWGEGFVSTDNLNMQNYDSFWYRQRYKDLVEQEVESYEKSTGRKLDEGSTIIFAGSGPLPLTLIDLHSQTGARVVGLTNDDNAVNLSKSQIEKLGLTDKIEIRNSNAQTTNYMHADLVMVAALVGQKRDVVGQIRRTAPFASIAVRSVEGAKTMLYEPVKANAFERLGLFESSRTSGDQGVINTTLFFRPGMRKSCSKTSCSGCVVLANMPV